MRLPGAIVDFIKTPLLSAKSKLLLVRAGRGRRSRRARKAGYDQPQLRAELDTESVAAYCERRLNPEIRDRMLNPLMGGLFVVDGGTVSVAVAVLQPREVPRRRDERLRRRDRLLRPRARRAALRCHDERDRDPRRTQRRGRPKVRGAWPRNRVIEEHEEQVDGVVLAIAAPQVPPVYPGLDSRLQAILLEGLKQANYMSVRFALKRRPDTDALLVVVPFGALGGIGTIMYEHNINPGAAPRGKGVVGVLLYHEWVTPRMQLSDDEIISETLREPRPRDPGDRGRWSSSRPDPAAGSRPHCWATPARTS